MMFGSVPVQACGLYYTVFYAGEPEKVYLPQVELQAHSTILETTSKTTLTQTFINPSPTKGIRETVYTFPLYDGVSVIGFTCHVGGRTIVGEVKEKEKATSVYTEAVARGETAGLFQQLETADVFSTTLGNVPPGANVVVEITYLGELKHDMEVNGIRFTIPNFIAPRYGRYPVGYDSNTAIGKGIAITVDVEMAEGSFIQKIVSPSHPISVSVGTTSLAPDASPTMSKASATLSLGTAQLYIDFVLQIITKDTGTPKAVLETHPTIPNQRALMATLVPRFALPPERPEIVFVCDRSFSMVGSNITLVRQALQVFLKSLPVGVMFNICSFGSTHSFLFPRSVSYTQETLHEAVNHVETFVANYGGTEMLSPIKATIEQRYRDMPLEIMLLTDGAIWNQQEVFDYLNEKIADIKAPIRAFTLGVGAGASTALIEGIAKAGNGFSQTVAEGEKMDSKVVRMLKGALSPHVDYSLEIIYDVDTKPEAEDDEDFEIIEKVSDSLNVKLNIDDAMPSSKPKQPISLFDTSVDPDKTEPLAVDETGEARYSHLPKVSVPKIIQAPQNVPSLFAFNRTSVYLLLGPDSPKETPRAVVLRGTSSHGPLVLQFPVQVLETPGETIHQLAVKKATSELEQGRGWLAEAKDESTGEMLKKQFEGRFSSMVEREAVRLGVQFQVSGKWCPFVAVEKHRKATDDEEKERFEWLEDEESKLPRPQPVHSLFGPSPVTNKGNHPATSPFAAQNSLFYQPLQQQQQQQQASLFGAPSASINPSTGPQLFGASSASSGNQLGSSGFNFGPRHQQPQPSLFGGAPASNIPVPGSQLFGSSQQQQQQQQQPQQSPPQYMPSLPLFQPTPSLTDEQMDLMLLEQQKKKRLLIARQEQEKQPQQPPQDTISSIQPKRSLKGEQMDLMLLEQQNKKRLLMVMEEQQQQPQQSPQNAPPSTSSLQSPRNTSDGTSTNSGSLFGSSTSNLTNAGSPFGNPTSTSTNAGALFGSYSSTSANAVSPFGSSTNSPANSGSLFGSSASTLTNTGSPFGNPATTLAESQQPSQKDDEILTFLVKLQTFEGYWDWSPELFKALGLSEDRVEEARMHVSIEKREWATAVVIAFFEHKLSALSSVWELVVEKAKAWLTDRVDTSSGLTIEDFIWKAGAMF